MKCIFSKLNLKNKQKEI